MSQTKKPTQEFGTQPTGYVELVDSYVKYAAVLEYGLRRSN